MGYRRANTAVKVAVLHLRLNKAQMQHCDALHRDAARCWNAMLAAHIASRSGAWLSVNELQKMFKGQFALYSQTVQALAEKLIANVDTARELRKTDPTARYPYREKLYQTVVWKQESIRYDGHNIVLSNGRGNPPLVLPLPSQYAGTDIRRAE